MFEDTNFCTGGGENYREKERKKEGYSDKKLGIDNYSDWKIEKEKSIDRKTREREYKIEIDQKIQLG